MGAKRNSARPVLAVDVDGVISLFGFEEPIGQAPCRFQLIDGMAHCISMEVGSRLQKLVPYYDLVWATGWEDRANEYLLHLLGLQRLPVLRFGNAAKFGSAHWKLDPIAAYAAGRPLAWIDDSFDDSCRQWARQRPEPTLLVPTASDRGLQDTDIDILIAWPDDYEHEAVAPQPTAIANAAREDPPISADGEKLQSKGKSWIVRWLRR